MVATSGMPTPFPTKASVRCQCQLGERVPAVVPVLSVFAIAKSKLGPVRVIPLTGSLRIQGLQSCHCCLSRLNEKSP